MWGYNCAQAAVVSYAEARRPDFDTAMRVAALYVPGPEVDEGACHHDSEAKKAHNETVKVLVDGFCRRFGAVIL